MATRAWAALTTALSPPLLTRRSCSRAPSASPARHSAATGLRLRSRRPRPAKFECRRAKNAGYEDYKFPDPIPEFAEQVSVSLPSSPRVGNEAFGCCCCCCGYCRMLKLFWSWGVCFRRRASSGSTWRGGWTRRRMTTSGSTSRRSSTSAHRHVSAPVVNLIYLLTVLGVCTW